MLPLILKLDGGFFLGEFAAKKKKVFQSLLFIAFMRGLAIVFLGGVLCRLRPWSFWIG